MEEIEKDLSRELDTLENAISDDNHALAIFSREEIWKIVNRITCLAVSKERERITQILLQNVLTIQDHGQFFKPEVINLINTK